VWLTEKGARRLEQAMPAWRRACDEISLLANPKALAMLAKKTRSLG
jgi:hypothetical protein